MMPIFMAVTRPWSAIWSVASGEGGGGKVLLVGNDTQGQGCLPCTLLETQLLDTASLDLSIAHLPEFLAKKEGILAYYYYPYGLSEPERFAANPQKTFQLA